MKLSTVIANSNIPATLIRAVVRQCGGWAEFKEIASDIVAHGADAGFGNFIYYTDTVAFSKRNRKYIMELLKEQSDAFGYDSIYQLISVFNCLRDDYSADEILETFYRDNDARTQVYNALAWYALEEVARVVFDMRDSEE